MPNKKKHDILKKTFWKQKIGIVYSLENHKDLILQDVRFPDKNYHSVLLYFSNLEGTSTKYIKIFENLDTEQIHFQEVEAIEYLSCIHKWHSSFANIINNELQLAS